MTRHLRTPGPPLRPALTTRQPRSRAGITTRSSQPSFRSRSCHRTKAGILQDLFQPQALSSPALRQPTFPNHRPRFPPPVLTTGPVPLAVLNSDRVPLDCPTCRAPQLISRTMGDKNCTRVRCPPTFSSFRPVDSQNPNDEAQNTPKCSATAQIPALSLICS